MGANDKFADYFKEWNKKTYPTRSETEHAEFVRNYVGDIALSLKEYGDKMGYNENDQFYKDLAWGGLTHWKKRDSTGNPVLDSNGNYVFELTTWFKNSFSSTEQSRILDVISIEQSGKDMNQKTKPKKGQNANC